MRIWGVSGLSKCNASGLPSEHFVYSLQTFRIAMVVLAVLVFTASSFSWVQTQERPVGDNLM